jgi:hypothetical protein
MDFHQKFKTFKLPDIQLMYINIITTQKKVKISPTTLTFKYIYKISNFVTNIFHTFKFSNI